MKRSSCDALIVGGGAAGMMAALTAANRGLNVLLIEKNPVLGKKLRITGKGRCNLTNDASPQEVMRNIPRNGKFLYSCLTRFPPSAVMSFFESIGVPLKVERGGRVFPVSDRADDVANALVRALREAGVQIKTAAVKGIEAQKGAVTGVRIPEGILQARHVLIATGGRSYPRTGSTGDGYRFASECGHTVTECVPSLVPLECVGRECASMQGLSLRNIGIRLLDSDSKVLHKDFGEMLFTHFGVSGPVVLSASAHLREGEGKKCRLIIDLKPALDEKKLELRLLRDIDQGKNKNYSSILSGLMNPMMIPVAIERTGVSGDTKANAITKEQRRRLLLFLKGFELEIKGKRPIEEAVITSGGVDVAQIEPNTMHSRLVSGLYFAGELIDTDAYTGGYNLQIAWSTGWAAGSNM